MTQGFQPSSDSTFQTGTEFSVVGYSNINGLVRGPKKPYVKMTVEFVANSECGIDDNNVDHCVKISSAGHLIQDVITLCYFGGKEMTIHWIIYLFIISMDIE